MSVVTPGNSPPLGSQLPEPLPPTTGPRSTPPSTRPEDDYPPEHHDEHRLLENIEATENVQRLGRLLAIDSVNRNLNTEDAAFRAEIERDMADDTITDGGKVDLGKDEADDQMKIYAANTGPLIIHRPDPPAQQPTPWIACHIRRCRQLAWLSSEPTEWRYGHSQRAYAGVWHPRRRTAGVAESKVASL